jgi:hypothetical protein
MTGIPTKNLGLSSLDVKVRHPIVRLPMKEVLVGPKLSPFAIRFRSFLAMSLGPTVLIRALPDNALTFPVRQVTRQ